MINVPSHQPRTEWRVPRSTLVRSRVGGLAFGVVSLAVHVQEIN